MPIATFGPSTAWAGKTITYDDGRFTLEGVGPIPAAAVLTYDRQGQISWAYDGLREWVQQLAATSPVAAQQVRPMGFAPLQRPAGPQGGGTQSYKVRNIIAIALAVAAIVILLIAVTFGTETMKPALDFVAHLWRFFVHVLGHALNP